MKFKTKQNVYCPKNNFEASKFEYEIVIQHENNIGISNFAFVKLMPCWSSGKYLYKWEKDVEMEIKTHQIPFVYL